MDQDKMADLGINPYLDVLSEENTGSFRRKVVHPFTDVDYVDLYKKIGKGQVEIYLANDRK